MTFRGKSDYPFGGYNLVSRASIKAVSIVRSPHAIELLNKKYADVFTILRSYPELENYLSPFVDAWESDANEQLQGQIAIGENSAFPYDKPGSVLGNDR